MLCSEKKQYTKKEAETVRNAKNRETGAFGGKLLEIYPCATCRHWHLTSKPLTRRTKQAIRVQKIYYRKK